MHHREENDCFKAASEKHAAAVAEKARIDGVEVTTEYEHFKEHNYAVICNVVSLFNLALVQAYVRKKEEKEYVKKEPMFNHVEDEKVVNDEKRKLFNCAKDWVLFTLIAVPVTLALATHGFLLIAGSMVTRTAKVVTFIESIGGGTNQSWHTDFDSRLASFFGNAFGLSVLLATSDDSEVDIISNTWGNETDDEIHELIREGNLKKIKLQKGSILLMGSGLRHRGCSYEAKNVRFFLAFLAVNSVFASFFHTYRLDETSDEKSRESFYNSNLVVEDWREEKA